MIQLWNSINNNDPNDQNPGPSRLKFASTLIEFAEIGKNYFQLDLDELRQDLKDESIMPIGVFHTGSWDFLYFSQTKGFIFQEYDSFYVLGFDRSFNEMQSFLDSQDKMNQCINMIQPYESDDDDNSDVLVQIDQLEKQCENLIQMIQNQ